MPFFNQAMVNRVLRRRRQPSSAPNPTPELQQRKSFPNGIKTLCSPDDGTIDIVFIHGLTGDREATWTAEGATEPWPKSLLPSILPTARILTFGYDAFVVDWRRPVSENFIGNHAWNLLTSLSSYRDNDDTNERPVIFVCHSLGGLVCKDALFQSRQRSEKHLQSILDCTRGIIFLGTPHHGAGLANLAEVVSRSIGLLKQTNPKIVDVLKRDSEVLARIQEGFHTMIKAHSTAETPPIEVTCFYEELPVLGVGLVVPQYSAILPGYITIGIHRNHMDMTKFVNSEDPGFVAPSNLTLLVNMAKMVDNIIFSLMAPKGLQMDTTLRLEEIRTLDSYYPTPTLVTDRDLKKTGADTTVNILTALSHYLPVLESLIPNDTSITTPHLWHNNLHGDNIFIDPQNPKFITSIFDRQSTQISHNHIRDPAFLDWDSLEPERARPTVREYTTQNIFIGWRKLTRAKSPALYRVIESRKTPAFGMIFLAHRMFEYGEAHFQSLLVDLKDHWEDLPGVSGDFPFPFSFSDAEIERIKLVSDGAVAGTELVAGVKEQLGDLWPDKGLIEHERYEECRAALEEVRDRIVEELGESEEEREEYRRLWPFD
ncbi:hypothetical protein CBS147343_5670 [Aspergillus niger]|nr:hypothetical protein CBS147371_5358 [Aspergillus niger]KAI2991811.1 hypothetical protein CBS147344_1199 [Aspergillus niger]KAI3015591.1 hypothetical protein CBS147482_3267 [Aspergillus niger]KAI3045295.1 hypothetical protein CBS147352_7844 [Aspergillus niger]KAI3071092.1 hypothetical protein CBS147343_5670 [Aspergillus niger]